MLMYAVRARHPHGPPGGKEQSEPGRVREIREIRIVILNTFGCNSRYISRPCESCVVHVDFSETKNVTAARLRPPVPVGGGRSD
jgi:hypothetical protein